MDPESFRMTQVPLQHHSTLMIATSTPLHPSGLTECLEQDLPNILPIGAGLVLIPFAARVKATIIDSLLVLLLVGSLGFLYRGIAELLNLNTHDAEIGMVGIATAVPWLYSAGLESAPTQGTVGKLFADARVATIDGARINFARASLRFIYKALSILLLPVTVVSALVAYKFERAQSLHDLFARTVVIQRRVRIRL